MRGGVAAPKDRTLRRDVVAIGGVHQDPASWDRAKTCARVGKGGPSRCRRGRVNKAPFRSLAGAIEFGAAGKKTAHNGRDDVSARLDDPSFPAPIHTSRVGAEDGESYALIWSRRTSD